MLFLKGLRTSTHFLAYHFYAKHKASRTDVITIDNFSLDVQPTVFHPQLYFSSKFLASYIRELDLKGKKVLDMGCGSGILSLFAAKQGANVVAVDINPAAIETTRKNAEKNGFQNNIITVKSDLFQSLSPLHRGFDIIISNPPYYPGIPRNVADKAWKGGDNYQFIRMLAQHASSYLSPQGKIIIILSSDADMEYLLPFFQQNNFLMQKVRTQRYFFETLYIFEGGLS